MSLCSLWVCSLQAVDDNRQASALFSKWFRMKSQQKPGDFITAALLLPDKLNHH